MHITYIIYISNLSCTDLCKILYISFLYLILQSLYMIKCHILLYYELLKPIDSSIYFRIEFWPTKTSYRMKAKNFGSRSLPSNDVFPIECSIIDDDHFDKLCTNINF